LHLRQSLSHAVCFGLSGTNPAARFAYDSRLKTWIRRFNGVATKYLDSYLGWFRTLDRSGPAGWSSSDFSVLAARS
jgi:hypothetical protein